MRRSPVWTSVGFAALILAAGCGEQAHPPGDPGIRFPTARTNPENQLSLLVRFTTVGLDSARAVFGTGTGPLGSTPFFPVSDGANTIPVLGLEPEATYWVAIEGPGPDEDFVSEPVTATTGPLPEALQPAELVTSGTLSTPFFSLTLNRFLVVYDGDGRVCWYREIPGYQGGDGGIEPDGSWTAFVGSPTGTAPEYGAFLEFDPAGREIDRIEAPFPRYTDGHELLLTVDGNGDRLAHVFSYTIRSFDFSSYGGSRDAPIVGHQLLRLRNGVVEFLWDGWDHFTLEDALRIRPNLYTSCTDCDLDHPNSLWIDEDGNYIASWAVQSEVTRIDSRTGEILWRLGGAHSDFTFVNDPWNGFSFQHYARTLPGGTLLLFDNGQRREPAESRAVEYALDPGAGTATLVWEYRHQPPLYTPIVGTAERLANGNTFIGFTGQFNFREATGPATMVEVDPAGTVVWQGATPDNRLVYRAVPVASLYRYADP